MAEIKPRIRIFYANGTEIAYTTDLNTIKSLQIPADDEFTDLHPISVGTILSMEDDVRLRVVNIYTHYHDREFDNSGEYGINLYGYGERYPFNFEITYHVEEVCD